VKVASRQHGSSQAKEVGLRKRQRKHLSVYLGNHGRTNERAFLKLGPAHALRVPVIQAFRVRTCAAMEISTRRFRYDLDVFLKHMLSASFVAIDFEFTGLGMEKSSQLDTPAARCRIARNDAETLVPCQFGVTLFRPARPLPDDRLPSDRDATWEALPFHFHLCPRPVFKMSTARFSIRDSMFQVQAPIARFLAITDSASTVCSQVISDGCENAVSCLFLSRLRI
jgi:hypothetical protein